MMSAKENDENAIRDLRQQKSLSIIQAQFQQSIGQNAEAARLFLEAALLEERLANNYRQTGDSDDAAISLFSAASCYKNAGHFGKAIDLAEEAASLTSSTDFAQEIRQFREQCLSLLTPSGGRTIRGIVRNGAVHPFDSDVLTEGELVTITTA